ncbi:hypothetical protein AC239_26960 [Bacteroides fragilis]|nr:hypothetical protein AC239_26960 [Bacteroides fragilis]
MFQKKIQNTNLKKIQNTNQKKIQNKNQQNIIIRKKIQQ